MLLACGIILVYFLLRLPNLTAQPIFADEAIYIRWAQVLRAVPSLRFIPLQDGKTPFFMWSMVPLLKIFSDPLLAGRLLSVLSGFGTLLGCLAIGWKFFNKRIAVIAAGLVAVTPFFVFFDRMALVDSMLTCFSVWSLFFGLWLVRYPRLDLAMILGYVLGLGWLTKTSGISNLVTMPFVFITFPWSKKLKLLSFLKTVGLFVISYAIAVIMFNILRLGPEFDKLSSRDNDYLFPLSKFFQTPWDPFVPHLSDIGQWSLLLLGVPLSLAICFGIVLIFRKRQRVGFSIFFWSLIPLLYEMIFIKAYTARYALYFLPGLILLAAVGLDWIFLRWNRKSVWLIVVLVVMISWPAFFDFKLLTSPATAPLPENEKQGYFRDWTAGYGFKDIAGSLTQVAQTQQIVVATDGSFGTLPDGLQIYLDKVPNIVYIVGKQINAPEVLTAAKTHLTFYITDKTRFQGASVNDELIKIFPKPKDEKGFENAILLFEVHPNAQ